jgi:RPC5 protein
VCVALLFLQQCQQQRRQQQSQRRWQRHTMDIDEDNPSGAPSSSYSVPVPPPGHEIDPDDEVVAELDVVLCNDLGDPLLLMQHPLRPTWRPYVPQGGAASARYKKNAKRLEINYPLDTESPQYFGSNDGPSYGGGGGGGGVGGGSGGSNAGSGQQTVLTLRSSTADVGDASLAVGLIRGNTLLLVPVDQVLQMRPDMSHVGAGDRTGRRAGGDGEDSEGDGDGAAGGVGAADIGDGAAAPTAVEVVVQRRETERQTQARLKSFAHLMSEEQQEEWVNLEVCDTGSAQADALLERLWSTPGVELADSDDAAAAAAGGGGVAMPQPLSRSEYLNAFVPAGAGGGASAGAAGTGVGGFGGAAGASAGGPGGGGAALAAGSSGQGAPAAITPEDMAAALGPALALLLGQHSVVSMHDVRRSMGAAGQKPALRAVAALPDDVLHKMLADSGQVVAVQNSYAKVSGMSPAAEPLRRVVLELLQRQPLVRKADVLSAAVAAGLPAPGEALYGRVMRELCRNNGGQWSIKAGADA